MRPRNIPSASWLFLVAFVGCDFQIKASTTSDASDAPRGFDAALTDGPLDAMVDAMPDAAPDAPLAACLTDIGYVPHPSSGHRYRAAAIALAWTAAQAECASTGAHLAVIDDDAENLYVDGLLAGAFWIGSSDLTTEGTWVWVTGAAVNAGYLNWRSGNPNDGGGAGTQDCGEMDPSNNTWNDYTCASAQTYVCECEPG